MSARDWPLLRRRSAGRHGDRMDIAPAPAALGLAAALPVPQPLLERPRRGAPVPPARREPVTEVTCGFCGVTGLSSAIPDVGGYGPRCADTDACARRWGNREAAGRLAPVAEPERDPEEDAPAGRAVADDEPAPAADATAVIPVDEAETAAVPAVKEEGEPDE